jgi:hypothetical protein
VNVKPIPVAVRSKVCSCLITGTAGSNPAEILNVRLGSSLCVV